MFLATTVSQSLIPAFTDAEGAGAYATGGRGGTVYCVTGLDAKDPGPLADAVIKPDRIIVFAASGVYLRKLFSAQAVHICKTILLR